MSITDHPQTAFNKHHRSTGHLIPLTVQWAKETPADKVIYDALARYGCRRPSRTKSTDSFGRGLVVVLTNFGNIVVYEYYGDDDKSKYAVVAPSEIMNLGLISDPLNLSAEEIDTLLGHDYSRHTVKTHFVKMHAKHTKPKRKDNELEFPKR